MITFTCQCGNKLHFENSQCLACGSKLGFLPDENSLSSLVPIEGNRYLAATNNKSYKSCKNYHEHEVCNWMVSDNDKSDLCQSCRLTEIIPDLTKADNIKLWYRIEKAKRRLLYTLNYLGLPIEGHDVDPEFGLSFRFMADKSLPSEFNDEFSPNERVMTGHSTGTITINLAEADPSTREETREKMNERYRTLLGHFRHESGHYYWDKLVRDSRWIDEYHELFGDETRDYQAALEYFYANGPIEGWEKSWISAYASAHPWEDFAETWAHYLHMIDTLETAHDFGFSVRGQTAASESPMQYASGYFLGISVSELLDDWIRLTAALNAMNRSMGLGDVYPFVLSDQIVRKLDMVHRLVADSRN
jgi:hypothetical protein